jgi:hypothetical protein
MFSTDILTGFSTQVLASCCHYDSECLYIVDPVWNGGNCHVAQTFRRAFCKIDTYLWTTYRDICFVDRSREPSKIDSKCPHGQPSCTQGTLW